MIKSLPRNNHSIFVIKYAATDAYVRTHGS